VLEIQQQDTTLPSLPRIGLHQSMTASTRRPLHEGGEHGGGGGFQRRPLAQVCKACGGQYFAASLPIHQKTCFARNAFVEIMCPACRSLVTSGTFHDHVACCKGILETPAIRRAVSKPEARPDELNSPEADGRVRCRNCERGFHADRIAKHQSVCVGTRRRNLELYAKTPVKSKARSEQQDRHYARPPIQTLSPKRRGSYVARIRGVLAMSLELSASSARPTSREIWGRGQTEEKRFDLVHRDGARRFDSMGVGSNLNLSLSTATSANNPLATTRLMTLHQSWG
jgi:hypothetical protein